METETPALDERPNQKVEKPRLGKVARGARGLGVILLLAAFFIGAGMGSAEAIPLIIPVVALLGVGTAGAAWWFYDEELTYTAAFEAWMTLADGESATCIQCNIVMNFASIGDALAKSTYVYLANGLSTFVVVLFALYILLQFVKLALPTEEMGSPAPLKRIAINGFFFSIIYFMLTPPGYSTYFEFFYEGLFLDSVNGATEIMSAAMSMCSDPDLQFSNSYPGMEEGRSAGGGGGTTGLRPIDPAALDGLMCQLHTVQRIMSFGLVIGQVSINRAGGELLSLNMTDAAAITLLGIVLIAVYGFGMITFGWYMIDVLMRSFVISALMPIFLLGAIFPLFRGWFAGATRGLLSSVFTLFFGAIIFSISAAVLCLSPQFFGDYDTTRAMFADMDSKPDFVISAISGIFWTYLLAGVIMLGALRRAAQTASEVLGGFGMEGVSGNMGHKMGAAVGAGALLGARMIPGAASVGARGAQWGAQKGAQGVAVARQGLDELKNRFRPGSGP